MRRLPQHLQMPTQVYMLALMNCLTQPSEASKLHAISDAWPNARHSRASAAMGQAQHCPSYRQQFTPPHLQQAAVIPQRLLPNGPQFEQFSPREM
ncbi:hypothetical protein GDO78_010770 [Eleutherodactylus coqui]|uniref:Uncharacterized protein n=1 Tax=Eleutherodactylus coqui TaxID=57060 RepID=A0A8J6F6P6_ELECQ|nr:hypothetical protein GDO78_010770 [Eleutherodactylus coqui]